MKAKEYCETVESQVAGWKREISEIMKTMDTFSDENTAIFDRLRDLLDAMEHAIEGLRTECPVWKTRKNEISKPFAIFDCRTNGLDTGNIAPEDM